MTNRFYFSISFDLISRTIVEILWFINSLLNYPFKKEKHSDFTFDKLVAYLSFFFFDIFSILYLYNSNENNLVAVVEELIVRIIRL